LSAAIHVPYIVEFVARKPYNPFDMHPPCDRYVPGYGDTTADFHVIGHHPGVHGGLETGIPFTDRPWSEAFFDALVRGGLVRIADGSGDGNRDAGEDGTPDGRTLECENTFLSYLHMCDPGPGGPTDGSYAEMERFFDAELRAITAHVLFPVGARATRHVLANYTAKSGSLASEMDALHGVELRGSGWLVVPIKEPAEWEDDDALGDAQRLVDSLTALRRTDYRQTSDLGRFLPGEDPYLVR